MPSALSACAQRERSMDTRVEERRTGAGERGVTLTHSVCVVAAGVGLAVPLV